MNRKLTGIVVKYKNIRILQKNLGYNIYINGRLVSMEFSPQQYTRKQLLEIAKRIEELENEKIKERTNKTML